MFSGLDVDEVEVEQDQKKEKKKKKKTSHFYIHKYASLIHHETLILINTIVKRHCIVCFTF